MSELSPTRLDALTQIALGKIQRTWPVGARPPYFSNTSNYGKLRKGVGEWLISNGYAELADVTASRNRKVVLTDRGREVIESENALIQGKDD